MKNSLLFILFLGLAANLGCSSKSSSQSDKYTLNKNSTLKSEVDKTASLAPLGTPYNLSYSKPETGMGITEFMYLCRKPDNITTSKTDEGTTDIYQYEFSESRAKNECWGKFAFGYNGKLDSISRK